MKSKKINRRLFLNKQTIARLGDSVMEEVHGGIDATVNTCPSNCYLTCPFPHETDDCATQGILCPTIKAC